MKTELPKSWHIIINNQEEAKVYKQYFDQRNYGKTWYYENNYIYGFDGTIFDSGCNYGILLSFEEFKYLVLKQDIEPNYEIY